MGAHSRKRGGGCQVSLRYDVAGLYGWRGFFWPKPELAIAVHHPATFRLATALRSACPSCGCRATSGSAVRRCLHRGAWRP